MAHTRSAPWRWGSAILTRAGLPIGLLGLLAVLYAVGAEALGAALAQITWGAFAVICAVHGVSVLLDTLGWRCTIATTPPAFRTLLAVRTAGEAVNVVTALGSVGGEAVKAWGLRRELTYAASIPSLIVAKTALVVAQTLLLALGILVAWQTAIAEPALLSAMGYLLGAQLIGVGGFLAVQVGGVIGRAGRFLRRVGVAELAAARQLDEALRGFYRRAWPRFLASVGFHFAGWLVGIVETWLILRSLGVPASGMAATVLEALDAGVRFATFFVPASVGPLEGANAAAFTTFGWTAGAGLAFTLVLRARQAVWIGVGLLLLVVMGQTRLGAGTPGAASPPTLRALPVHTTTAT